MSARESIPGAPDAGSPRSVRAWSVLLVAAIVVGLVAGIGGTTLVWVLHLVQHGAYGYEVGSVRDAETFLQGASEAPASRRAIALAACGVVAGVGWWSIERFARPLVHVEAAWRAGARMPVGGTIAHALLQVITVGLGSPLGREEAPREIGALFAQRVAARIGLTAEEGRVLIACGAGAGLAAVYNVPLGGAVFALEILAGTFRASVAVPVLLSSGAAALVAKIGLHDPRPYDLPPFTVGLPLLAWALVTGPIFGVAASGFARVAQVARARAPHGLSRLAWCVPTYLVLGALAAAYPELAGNGRGATQLGLTGGLPLGRAAVLFVLRFVATTASLRAGASGGLITPSLALGALLGVVLGHVFSLASPGIPSGAFAVLGATAFLATSRRMPIAALVLAVEMTRVDHEAWVPLLLAVGGAAAVGRRSRGT